MLICQWKGCELAFEELAAFQEHVITKHALQQQRQLNLDKQQNDVGTEETVVQEQIEKLNLLNGNKMLKKGGSQR
jgi:hypothetical protein